MALLLAACMAAAPADVDIYSTKDLKALTHSLADKKTPFVSQNLKRYAGHYTMMAYREATGSSELHEHEADIFVIEEGAGTLVLGGKLVGAKTQKPGELRGTSIEGGERRTFEAGDIIHIPAGTPHQILIDKGKPVSYFVVKVTGQ
jgi:mannose-6-phosphate isomerase-like protein (cupin superfamily)